MNPPIPAVGRDAPESPRPPRHPRAAQILVVTLTGVSALTASAALAWSLQSWRGRPGRDSGLLPASPAVAPADRGAALLMAGRLAYQVHCARCHGAEGHGDGPDAERLDPPPRDFASGQWRSAPTSESVRRAIVAGIPGTPMPGWGDSLSGRELDGLVAHVLALAPPTPLEDVPLTPALRDLIDRAGFVAEANPGLAPPLDLIDLDGRETTLADRRGRPVLVLFWGTTCASCLDELPAVLRLAGRGLDVLPVCVDAPDAPSIRDAVGPDLPSHSLYLDPGGLARLRYDVQSLPTFALIDPSGRLIARAQGARDWAALGDFDRREEPAETPSPTSRRSQSMIRRDRSADDVDGHR